LLPSQENADASKPIDSKEPEERERETKIRPHHQPSLEGDTQVSTVVDSSSSINPSKYCYRVKT
jgi:hypothetical protein